MNEGMSEERRKDVFGFEEPCGARWYEDLLHGRVRARAAYRDRVVMAMGTHRAAASQMCDLVGEQGCAYCGFPLGIKKDAPLSGCIVHPECLDKALEQSGPEGKGFYMTVEQAVQACRGMVLDGGDFYSAAYRNWLESEREKAESRI